MVPVFIREYLIIMAIVNAIGILNCLFIVFVNFLDLSKGRSLNTCDLILVAIGTSCTCFQCTTIGHAYLSWKWSNANDMYFIDRVLPQILLCTGSSTFWFIACLCDFYCLKIVDFHHHLLFWVTSRISKVIPWLLLGSLVLSLAISMPVYWNSCSEMLHNTTNVPADCSYLGGGRIKYRHSYLFVASLLGVFTPLLFTIASITLILISLCRHTKRMKENASGFSRPRLEAHFGAAKMVGSLLSICIFHILVEIFLGYATQPVIVFILWTINISFTPAKSTVLILGNTKLKKAAQEVLVYWRK